MGEYQVKILYLILYFLFLPTLLISIINILRIKLTYDY